MIYVRLYEVKDFSNRWTDMVLLFREYPNLTPNYVCAISDHTCTCLRKLGAFP